MFVSKNIETQKIGDWRLEIVTHLIRLSSDRLQRLPKKKTSKNRLKDGEVKKLECGLEK